MAKKRFTAEEIIGLLREVDVKLSRGQVRESSIILIDHTALIMARRHMKL